MSPSSASIRRPDRWKLFVAFLAIGLFMAIVVLLVMAKIHEEIAHPFLERLDQQGMQAIHAHASPSLTRAARFLSWIGAPATLVPIISVSAIVLWLVGWRRDASLLVLGIGGSGALDIALKLHFRRVRPEVPWAFVTEHSFSFPSGHSVAAVVLYGSLTYLIWRHLHHLWQRTAVIAAALLLIAGIGASRIYLGVHFPSDVAAGYAVGLIWLLPVIGSCEFVRREEAKDSRRHKPKPIAGRAPEL
jgi:membrane-associated phospholipid phosphatase